MFHGTSVPRDAKIFVAGHRGMVGSAIVRALRAANFTNIITRNRETLDLTNETAVNAFFEAVKPEYVYMAAAKVGGIVANDTYPVDFLLDNLRIQNAVISAAHRHGVKKLLFLSSLCIFPKDAPQPIKEEYLLSAPLEPTNQWYSVAKIAGVKLCQALRKQHGFDAIIVNPVNLYGPNDNFHPDNSHVLPALIRRIVDAEVSGKSVITCWGSGNPRREFLHVDDLAEACLHLMDVYSDIETVNVGCGTDISIKELAELVQNIVGWQGTIEWDTSKPDGVTQRIADITRVSATGWKSRISLEKGVFSTCQWFLENRIKNALRI